MNHFYVFALIPTLLAISACTDAPTGADTNAASAENAATPVLTPPTAPSVDAEFEALKALTPVDACVLLSAEKLAAIFPQLKFAQHQHLAPRMSGYVWDSRCVYWAGVGSVDYAKDVPTHTLELFVNTAVSSTKAQANLASRNELARAASGYQAHPELGANAYSIVQTGAASLFVVKDQSELQINTSDLSSSNDAKRQKLIEIFRAL